jgi:WD40 repeat protein
LLSASEDRTVRLWHVQRPGCLVVFKHPAPVSSVDFSPGSDTVFASGAEATLRLWSVPDKRAVQWHSVRRSITALCFSRDGAMVIVGLDDGEIQFHTCDQHGIKFFTQIECRNRRGVQRRGKKVTGIETCRGRLRDMVLVSTNDSRVRLCSVDTFLCVAKFKGATNSSSPVAAACCEYSDHVLCGSEDRNVYLWKRTPELEGSLVDSKKKSILGNVVKKCAAQESFLAHGSAVTAALFAPARTAKIARNTDNNTQLGGAFILTGGADGHVHVFENQMDL